MAMLVLIQFDFNVFARTMTVFALTEFDFTVCTHHDSVCVD